MKEVFRIIFEIASCPWKDSCEDTENRANPSCSLVCSSVGEVKMNLVLPEQCDLMIRSMILRKKYGGMACDKRMLDSFVSVWEDRYQKSTVDSDTLKRCFPNSTDIQWKDVPFLFHASGRNMVHLLDKLLSTQLLRLTIHDVCAAGIDFHCTSVMDFLTKDPNSSLITKLCKHLGSDSNDKIGSTLQRIMWDYSSGINKRRSFSVKDGADNPNVNYFHEECDLFGRLLHSREGTLAFFKQH